jgi:hypothetical protein
LRPQLDLPASTFLEIGLPIRENEYRSQAFSPTPGTVGTVLSGVLARVSIRHLPDMSTLRSATATPTAGPDDLSPTLVFDETLSRYLVITPAYRQSGTYATRTVTEVDARTGATRALAVFSGRKHPDVLGYLDQDTAAFASKDMTSEVITLADRASGSTRRIARFPAVYANAPLTWWTLLGVVREP